MVISNFQPKPSANQSPVAEQFEWHVSRCWPKCQSIGHWPHHNLRDKKTSIEKGNTGAGWLEKQKMFQKQYRGLRREFEKNRAWNRLCHTVAPFKFHPNSTYSPHGFLQSVSVHWVLKVQQSTNPQVSPHFTSHLVSFSLSTFSPRNDPSWSSVAPTQGVAPASQIAGGPAPSGHARRSPSRIAHDEPESWLKTVANLDFLAWLSIPFMCLYTVWSICAWSFPHLESWRCKRPHPPHPPANTTSPHPTEGCSNNAKQHCNTLLNIESRYKCRMAPDAFIFSPTGGPRPSQSAFHVRCQRPQASEHLAGSVHHVSLVSLDTKWNKGVKAVPLSFFWVVEFLQEGGPFCWTCWISLLQCGNS